MLMSAEPDLGIAGQLIPVTYSTFAGQSLGLGYKWVKNLFRDQNRLYIGFQGLTDIRGVRRCFPARLYNFRASFWSGFHGN
jgi:hypothetical protein